MENNFLDTFDSKEELYFSWWVEELMKAGYISMVTFQPPSFVLSEPVITEYLKPMKKVEPKLITQELMKGHVYTTDAQIMWDPSAEGIFYLEMNSFQKERPWHLRAKDRSSFIEIKANFDFKNMTRASTINIKWVWEKYKVFINLVKLEQLFKTTFTPQRYLLTDKSHVARTLKYKPRTLSEFIASVQVENTNNR